MNEQRDPEHDASRPSQEDLEGDRRLEVILDECVKWSQASPWEAALTARVMASRPFAPWEARRAKAWRAPALAAGGLLAASVAIFLAPLWSLGPGTALEMWARVIAAGTAGAIPSLLAVLPAISDALASVFAGSPGTRGALGAALLASGGTLALLARLLSRRPSRALAGANRG